MLNEYWWVSDFVSRPPVFCKNLKKHILKLSTVIIACTKTNICDNNNKQYFSRLRARPKGVFLFYIFNIKLI